MEILEVKNLNKTFNLHILNDKIIEALNNVNFTVFEGEIVGLTGKSGSGKSTLIKCLNRTYLCSGGEIVFNSKKYGKINLVNASDFEILQLRKSEIYYCSQFLNVMPRKTTLDLVINAYKRKHIQNGIDARLMVENLLEKLGLPQELWDAYPSTFSGGEQQRVNIAMALVASPRLLFIDEPTASLDLQTKKVVVDLIKELRSQGTSIVLISHDEYTLSQLTDRNIDLVNGTIKEIEIAVK